MLLCVLMVNFCMWCEVKVEVKFYFILAHGYLIVPAPFPENNLLFSLDLLLKINWPSVLDLSLDSL